MLCFLNSKSSPLTHFEPEYLLSQYQLQGNPSLVNETTPFVPIKNWTVHIDETMNAAIQMNLRDNWKKFFLRI
jgi:hypothetical protein